MNILNISGGGTKVFGEAIAVQVLMQDKKEVFDIITGVSAGAYIAVPLAMGLFDAINGMQSGFNLDSFFDPKPVNEKGNITLGAIARIASGKYWLGDQRKSLDLLSKVITPDLFKAYVSNLSIYKGVMPQRTYIYPEVYLLSVDFRSGANNLVRVRDLTYQEYLDQVLASGSIPIYTKGVEAFKWLFNGNKYVTNGMALLFDGGIRNHIASTILLQDLQSKKVKVDRVVSIYARPKDYNIAKPSDWMPSDISTSLTRTLDIMEMQLSKADEDYEKLLAQVMKFELVQLFLPDILQGTYDVDATRMKQYRDECYKVADNPIDDNSYSYVP